ncbi:MAG: hypothetical protein M3Q58_05515 [Bacteroidota bacterium]|nr:hypothetical protein [Bacteroidota bacterium]
MKRVLFLATVFFLFLFGSCKLKNSETIVKKWYYEDGSLKKIQEYKNDSIEHGKYLFYYPNGHLKDSGNYVNGKFHGERIEYYENGHPYVVTNYINGKERNGLNYRQNGSLNEYIVANYFSDIMFIIRYDSVGKMIKYEGNPICNWFIKDTIPLSQKFDIELLIANPPNCITKVIVSDWDILKNQAISKAVYIPDKFNRVNYFRNQNPEMDMYILNTVNIKDTIYNWTITDSVFITINREGITSYFKTN